MDKGLISVEWRITESRLQRRDDQSAHYHLRHVGRGLTPHCRKQPSHPPCLPSTAARRPRPPPLPAPPAAHTQPSHPQVSHRRPCVPLTLLPGPPCCSHAAHPPTRSPISGFPSPSPSSTMAVMMAPARRSCSSLRHNPTGWSSGGHEYCTQIRPGAYAVLAHHRVPHAVQSAQNETQGGIDASVHAMLRASLWYAVCASWQGTAFYPGGSGCRPEWLCCLCAQHKRRSPYLIFLSCFCRSWFLNSGSSETSGGRERSSRI